jgi:hypothetical protein
MSYSDVPKANTLALSALILGIVAIFLPFLGLLIGIAAVILGIIALKNPHRRGMAITGIITGGLAIPITAFLGLFLAILVPGLHAARTAAREAVAMSHMKAISSGLAMYAAQYNDRLPTTLGPAAAAYAAGVGPAKSFEDPRLATHPGDPATGFDFYFAAPGQKYAALPQAYQFVVLYDVPGGTHRLVGFADGHIEKFLANSPELDVVVTDTNRSRAAMGLAPLPAGLNGPPPP